jgi:Na+-transporting methylmalonyl-CoA/oxaloacetate decarboxylase gamma subunit
MFLVNSALQHISISTAAIISAIGYLVVFVGLVCLMLVIMVMGKLMVAKKAAAVPAKTPDSAMASPVMAPGSAGSVRIFSVPDKDAALLMAIVADKLGKPLNELRFKTIKEV